MTFVTSPKSVAIGGFAGLASALLALSPVGGSLLAVPLTMVVALPLAIVGLGWGTPSAIIGVIAATVALLAVSPGLALYFCLFLAPPAVIGSHLVGLSREQSGDDVPARREWYPLGRVLCVMAFLIATGAIIVAILEGFNPSNVAPDQIRLFTQAYVAALAQTDATIDQKALEEAVEPAIAVTLGLLPFVFSLTWTAVATGNLWVAIWVTQKSGNLARPAEDLAGFELPGGIGFVFAIALLMSLIGGTFGAMAAAFCGASAALLVILGLAVLHTFTRGLAFRVPLLILVYLFIGLCGLPLLVVGLVEPFLRLRHRRSLRPPPNQKRT